MGAHSVNDKVLHFKNRGNVLYIFASDAQAVHARVNAHMNMKLYARLCKQLRVRVVYDGLGKLIAGQ